MTAPVESWSARQARAEAAAYAALTPSSTNLDLFRLLPRAGPDDGEAARER